MGFEMKYSIVAQTKLGLDSHLVGILSGTPVVLVRQPENRYDENAVMVLIDDKHVGYIPRAQNTALAYHIDWKGRDYQQFVVRANAKPGDTVDGDLVVRKAIDGKFVRSPNSAYPMVEIEDF